MWARERKDSAVNLHSERAIQEANTGHAGILFGGRAGKKPGPRIPERMSGIVWTVQRYGLVLFAFTSFFPRLSHLQEYLFFLLLFIALGTAWAERTPMWVRTPIDRPLLSFVGWVLVTVPFATDPAYSFAEWRKLVAHALVFYWALLVFRAHEHETLSRRVMGGVALGSTALSVYALVEFVSRGGTWMDRYVRAGAPSSDYNWLSTYMVMAIPMLVAACVISRWRWQRAAYASAAVLAVVAQTASYTRAGWLGLVAEGVAFALFAGRRRLLIAVFALTLFVAGGLVVATQVGYQKETVDPWTLHSRLAVWKLGLEEIVKHPIVGVGYGNETFVKAHPEYSLEAQKGQDVRSMVLPAMHNTLFMVVVGSGIPALAFFVWVLISAVKRLIGEANSVSDLETKGLLIGTSVVVVGFAVRNCFDYMFAGSLACLFWILVATGLTQQGLPSSERG